METLDLSYLCTTIGSLCGIPVRIFQNRRQIFYYSVVSLPKDPLIVYENQVLEITDHVGYFWADDFHYYGIVNSGELKIVVGPSRQIPDTTQELRELAFRADVPADETDDFIVGMKSIVQMPIESILQMLCTINYILNGEKKSLRDIAITDSGQSRQDTSLAAESVEALPADSEESPDPSLHNTYDLEQALMHIIRTGDTAALTEWLSSAPAVRGGVLAPDQLRQRKNTFIVTATLASRAAIRGGMDVDDAFTRSDAYIQKCEKLTSPEQIIFLQYHMIIDYTERVSRLHQAAQQTQLVLDVSNYILHHISEVISTEMVAGALHMSRTYLCRKFKKDAGITLNAYILSEKTEEAKRLLRYTDKSLSAISAYLAFSSQSHFSRVFRENTGLSPSEYRLKHHG